MAVNNIKIFDQNKANMLTDEAYNSNTQRINGVQQGIASSQLQNKTLYQVSLVAYAIGQMMQANGLDANDADAVSTFANNMSQTIMQKVLDKANSDEAIAGTNNTKFITPLTLKAAVGSYTGRNLKNNDFRSYTTVLAAANAAAPGGTFFATNVPDSLYNAADRPFGISAEFQYLVLCDADNLRKTVLAFNFNQSNSNVWYSRNIWQGNWNDSQWKINAECETAAGIAANGTFAQRRFIMSPQTPIAYCQWGRRIGNTGCIAYMLPNQEANLILPDMNATSLSMTMIIFNISTGVEYATSMTDGLGTRSLLAYDNTSLVFIDNLVRLRAYRFSSTSAFTLASEAAVTIYRGRVAEDCKQNAFDNAIHLFGAYGIISDEDFDATMGTFDFNKQNNNLYLKSSYVKTVQSDAFPTGLVRLNETLAAVLNRPYGNSYGNGCAVAFINEAGAVSASYSIPRAESGELDNNSVVCALQERIIVGGGSTPTVVDAAGGYARTTMQGTAFNLPDKTCLLNNAHYSGWDGPDAYPGASSKAGNSVDASWNVQGNGIDCWLYESYNGRFAGTRGSYSLIMARATSIPYSFFIL
nr:MAG TPA: hypothetical protein [Caudoviricetes sp.]